MRSRFLKTLVPVLSLTAAAPAEPPEKVSVSILFPIEQDEPESVESVVEGIEPAVEVSVAEVAPEEALQVEQLAALDSVTEEVVAEVAPEEQPALLVTAEAPAEPPQAELAAPQITPEISVADVVPADAPQTVQPAPKKSEPRFIQYRNRVMVFTPFHQGYERTENDALYVGIEAYAASVMAQHKHHHDNTLFNAEVRLGYNYFYNGRDHLTPFVGGGYVQQFYKTERHHHNHIHHKPGVGYATVGFLYSHEFNSIFGLGFNSKFLLGGPVSDRRPKWGAPVVGLDFAMPWIFRFGHKRHWDVRIEPFYMLLHGSSLTQHYLGFRNSIGYRF